VQDTKFDRGFTGHEHLDQFGLINMGGRMHEPLVHRFLSSDLGPMEPDNTQSYNMYSYCMNNPLKYIDPTGWFPVNVNGAWYDYDEQGNPMTDDQVQNWCDYNGFSYLELYYSTTASGGTDNEMYFKGQVIGGEYYDLGELNAMDDWVGWGTSRDEAEAALQDIEYDNELNIFSSGQVTSAPGKLSGKTAVVTTNAANGGGNDWNKGYRKMTSAEFVQSSQAQIKSLNDAGTISTLAGAGISALLMKAHWTIGGAGLLMTTAYALDISNMDGEMSGIFNEYLEQSKEGDGYVLNKSVYVKKKQSGWAYPGGYMRTNYSYYTEDGVLLGTLHGW
jgi:RHS repeat-associated protein